MSKVTVACKLPHGLILRVFDEGRLIDPSPNDSTRTVPFAFPREEQVVVNGYAAPIGVLPRGTVSFGYALTHDVDEGFFELWMQQNRHSDIVKNKLIFAYAREADATAAAKDNVQRRNGLEALDPENLPPEFRMIERAKAD